jgi:cytochrome c5
MMRLTLLCLFLAVLLAACGGEADKPVADGSGAPDGGTVATDTPTDGKALLEERCTVCHNLDRVYAEKRDETGWNAVVDAMVSKGAKLDAAERDLLVAYLVSL